MVISKVVITSKFEGRGRGYAVFLTLSLLLFACSKPPIIPIQKDIGNKSYAVYYIKGVPFYPPEEYYCGPASLASVMNYWGYKVSQEEIAREVYIPRFKGVIATDLALYAEKRGFRVEERAGDLEILKRHISQGHPVIVFLDLGIGPYSIGHYTVVLGYNDLNSTIIAHSGREESKVYTYKRFLRHWKRTEYWMLVPLPADKGTER